MDNKPYTLINIACPECGANIVIGRIDFNGQECNVYLDEYDCVYDKCKVCNTEIRSEVEIVRPKKDFC